MRAHNDGFEGGYVLRNQGGGIWAIKASAKSPAACLFFSSRKENDIEVLSIVAALNTVADEIPRSVIEAAREKKRRPRQVDRENYLDRVVRVCARKVPGFEAEWRPLDVIHDLVRIRVARRLSQEQVADRMGLPRPRVTELERTPGRISFRRIVAYASAIDATLVALQERPRRPRK
ncbi:MAG TPA: helix-turn-helix transcriptional regulator [Fimbriimonadaceae bacterium]|nr:helix-turn-helix transcriptional regulator [Fimbriimonadaceae bacterium]